MNQLSTRGVVSAICCCFKQNIAGGLPSSPLWGCLGALSPGMISFYNLVVFVLLKFLISGLGSSMDFCQGRSSLAICDFEDFPFVKDFLCENCAVTAQWTNFKPLSSATPGEMQDGKYEKLAQWLSASARLNNLSYLALYSNKGETLVSLCYAFQHCAQICQIWPKKIVPA